MKGSVRCRKHFSAFSGQWASPSSISFLTGSMTGILRCIIKSTNAEATAASARSSRTTMFPASLRGVLLQFYIHDITWLRIPPERREELRRSLLTRIARRYCREYQPTGKIGVYSSVERIDPRFNTETGKNETLLMSFGCRRAELFTDELMIAP